MDVLNQMLSENSQEGQIVSNTEGITLPVTGWLSLEVQSMVMAMLVSALLVIVISLSAAWLVSTAEDLGPRKRRQLLRLRSGATYDAARSSSNSSSSSDDENISDQRSDDSCSSEEDESVNEETSSASGKTNCSDDDDEDEDSSENYEAIDTSGEDSDELLLETEIPMKPTTEPTTMETGLEGETDLKKNHGGRPRLVVRAGRSITFRWVRERRRQYSRL